MDDNEKIEIWEWEPHANSSYDWGYTRVSEDPTGQKAIDGLCEAIHSVWDSCPKGDLGSFKVTATIKRTTAYEEDLL